MRKTNNEKLNAQISSFKKISVFFAFLNSLYAILLVFFAYCSKEVINLAIDHEVMTLWIVLLCVSGASVPLVKGLTTYLSSLYSDNKTAIVRSILFEDMLKKDSLSLSELKNGELLNRLMSDSRMIVTYYTHFIPEVLGESVQLIGSLILIIFIKPILGLLILALGLLAMGVMFVVRFALRKEEKKMMKEYDGVTSFIGEGVENTETIKIIADKDEISSRLVDKQNRYLNARKKHRVIALSFSSLFSLSVQIVSIALIIYGAIKISKSEMTYGDLAALIELVALFKSPISALSGVQSALASYDAGYERINKLLNLKEGNKEAEISGKIKGIRFDHVNFGYKENELVIKDSSFVLSMDEINKFDGNSGKGKTTMFKLLLGIYEPKDGKISVVLDNGEEIDVTKLSLLSQFAYVPQSCLVFGGTILENLRLSNPTITKEEAIEALKMVNLSNFDTDYTIKENNEGLSRGEAQRLCIARAILSKKPYLILDEATSSLDDENAKNVLNLLLNKYKGILISSHKDEETESFEVKHIKI